VTAAVPRARTLLDAACGPGAYLEGLQPRFDVRGFENDLALLHVARSRELAFDVRHGSIERFETDERSDVVVALRGTIAEARTVGRLHETVARLAAARAPQGVLLVEPYGDPLAYEVGAIEAIHVDEPRVKISRMIVTKRVAHLAVLDYHYLIATNHGVERYFERIERGLYARTEYERAFAAAGLRCELLLEPAFAAGLYRGT